MVKSLAVDSDSDTDEWKEKNIEKKINQLLSSDSSTEDTGKKLRELNRNLKKMCN